MSRGGGPPGRAAAHQPARARAAVGRGTGARRHGVAAPGDPPSGKRADGTHPAAARRATRARAGPRAAIRLSRQPRPVGDRDPAVLPPGGVVGVAAGARRTGALLRRSRRRRVRRRALLRDGAGRHGATPWHAAVLRPGGGGVGALLEIARTHPDPGVRRKAVKMVGEVATAEAALGVLERLAQRDPDVEVQQEAVEALGHLGSPQAIAPLARLARAQPNAEVRDEAVEQYARSAAPESALVLLVDRLANDSSPDVTVEAVARLADLPDGLGIPALREAARSHPSRHVRAEARRRLEDYR